MNGYFNVDRSGRGGSLRRPAPPPQSKPSVEDFRSGIDEFAEEILREMLGKGVDELSPRIYEYMHYQAFRDGVLLVIHDVDLDDAKKVVEGATPEAIEVMRKYFDGEYRWLGGNLDVKNNPFLTAMVDLTYKVADRGDDKSTSMFLTAMAMFARSKGYDDIAAALVTSALAHDSNDDLLQTLRRQIAVEKLTALLRKANTVEGDVNPTT